MPHGPFIILDDNVLHDNAGDRNILVICCLRSYILSIDSAGNSATQTCQGGRFEENVRLWVFATHIMCLPDNVQWPQNLCGVLRLGIRAPSRLRISEFTQNF